MAIMDIIWIGGLVGCFLFVVFVSLFLRWFIRIEKRVKILEVVLSQADPGLARRVLEGGTGVIFNNDWEDPFYGRRLNDESE